MSPKEKAKELFSKYYFLTVKSLACNDFLLSGLLPKLIKPQS